MSLIQIIQLILGTAESIVPIFIHNPKSQQIEGVIATTLNGVTEGLGTVLPTTTSTITGK